DQNGTTQKIGILFTAGKIDWPIITEAPSEVCLGKKFYDAAGLLHEGAKNCASGSSAPPPPACAADGAVDCLTNANFRAIDMSAVVASRLVSGTTIGGVSGTLADCAADGAAVCVTSASFRACEMSRVTAGHVRSGITIAGVTGAYPSASHPL